jgi:hypothetical protein
MSQVTHLASGALTRSGDQLSIEIHQPADSPSFVMVVWLAKPTVTAATPKALAAVAAAIVRCLARRKRNSPRRSGLDGSHKNAGRQGYPGLRPWSARHHDANRSKAPPVGGSYLCPRGHIGWGDRQGRAPTILTVKPPGGQTKHN